MYLIPFYLHYAEEVCSRFVDLKKEIYIVCRVPINSLYGKPFWKTPVKPQFKFPVYGLI